MAAEGLVRVAVSITSLDADLARTLEPRAPTPSRRLETVRQLTEAGIPTTVMTAPIIPALNDEEIERLLDAAKAAGATSAGYVLLRLPYEIKDLFQEWLAEHRPDRLNHVMSLVKSTRGGKAYQAEWGKRMIGDGVYAWTIGRRFELATKRLGLNQHKASAAQGPVHAAGPQGRTIGAVLMGAVLISTPVRDARHEVASGAQDTTAWPSQRRTNGDGTEDKPDHSGCRRCSGRDRVLRTDRLQAIRRRAMRRCRSSS